MLRPAHLLLVSFAAALLAALSACGGGDDGETERLAPGDYAFQVSGTLDIELVEESVSAAALAGQPRTRPADVSGGVTLTMGEDGSFELAEWGISGTLEVDGGTVTIAATDSPAERSTGKTDSGGTRTDVYWRAETANGVMYVGYNAEAVRLSGGERLTPDTRSFRLEAEDGAAVPFMSDSGEVFLRLHGARLDFSLSGGGQTPTPQATLQPTPTPAQEPTQQPQTTPTPGSQVQTVRVDQGIRCQHSQPGVRSDLFDVIIVYLKENFPAQSRNQGSAGSPALALAAGEGAAAVAAGPSLAREKPLEGVTVNATLEGPGVIDNSASGVTNVSGVVTLRFGINKFGSYTVTVDSVVAPDGTPYEFDQLSVLAMTYEVGEVCE